MGTLDTSNGSHLFLVTLDVWTSRQAAATERLATLANEEPLDPTEWGHGSVSAYADTVAAVHA